MNLSMLENKPAVFVYVDSQTFLVLVVMTHKDNPSILPRFLNKV